jgi:hypothetical protein
VTKRDEAALDDEATGLERAVFGNINRQQIDAWLISHVRTRLSAEVSTVLFRSGQIGAVYGLRLSDGSNVVVKVHRQPVFLDHLSAASACQRVLADAGYPCPSPLDGPAVSAGHTATIEAWLDGGEPGNAHQPEIRKTMAKSLAMQPEILRTTPADILAKDPPAWASYARGPWPTPHDPIFDFNKTVPGYQWLDDLAAEAARVLQPPTAPEVIGHSDWACQNVRFAGGEVIASYDWDSLIGQSEAVLAGFGASSFTEGSTAGASAPSPEEVAAFLADYDDCLERRFTGEQQVVAAAAATWVIAYNARCGVCLEALGYDMDAGCALQVLERHRDDYLRVLW